VDILTFMLKRVGSEEVFEGMVGEARLKYLRSLD
jgi:hypothetical protein